MVKWYKGAFISILLDEQRKRLRHVYMILATAYNSRDSLRTTTSLYLDIEHQCGGSKRTAVPIL